MEILTLEKICEAKSSNIAQKDLDNNNGCYPIYGASGFIKNVDFYKFEKPYLAIVKDGAGVGRVMSLPGKSSIIGTMQAILPKDNVDIDYLYYYLKSKNLGRYYTGATIPHIYFKDYKNEKCNIYSLAEQKIVSKKLKLIDSLIDYKNKQIEQLNQLIKSQFVEMFKDCPQTKLCEIANITMGQSPNSESYNDSADGMPFFQGQADYGDKYTIVKHWTNQPSKFAYKGDVLMSVRAPVGPVNISSCDCCIGRGLCSITSKDGLTNNEFLFNALNTIQEEIASKGTGSTFKAITKNDVYNIELPLGSIELQNKFAQIVEQIDKQKFEFENSLRKLEELQASLMQEYFG